MIKPRMMSWAGHAAHTVGMRTVYEVWSEYLKKTDHLKDTSISGRIRREWQGVD
jgi:hypothetical protein